MSVFDYLDLGIRSMFHWPEAFTFRGKYVSITVLMMLLGFLLGIFVCATFGPPGPFAMAIFLPILISIFG